MIAALWLFILVMPPQNVVAKDTPGDGGNCMTVTWTVADGEVEVKRFEIWRAEAETDFSRIGSVRPGIFSYLDNKVVDGRRYNYKILAITATDVAFSQPAIAAVSRPQWFNLGRLNVVIVMLIVFSLVLWFIYRARRGDRLFIRRIAGLDAIDEAVGRATEMGRPILYVPGLSDMSDIATIASMNILGEIAQKTAQYEVPIIVPNADPIVYTVAREVVKEACTKAGRPDVFNPDLVYFVTNNQFGYAAAVDGIMTREKPATNFFIGGFAAEALILAETGASTGAIQIAGTDYLLQLPFFVCSCDYTLIGEELYAASAYLSREPLLLGALKGQDICKAILLGLLIIFSAIGLATRWPVLNLFR